jgi:hypothetical protein
MFIFLYFYVIFSFFSIIGSILIEYIQYIEKILEKLLKKFKKSYTIINYTHQKKNFYCIIFKILHI